MRALVRATDNISEYTGKLASWLCPALVLVITYEVTARYVFNAPTVWAFDSTTMLLLAIGTLGWGYTLHHDGHVKIDIIYHRLSPRRKALVTALSYVFLFFPFISVLLYQSVNMLWYSISRNQVLTGAFWYPPAWPIRTVAVIGIIIFALQGIAEFIRNIAFLRGEHHA